MVSEGTGVSVAVDRWVAQGFTPAQAMSASGMALGLMAIADQTELSLELRQDWRGQQSGKKLTGGTIALEQVGRQCWGTLLFPEPVILTSQPHWVLVKAARGGAVWLVKPGSVSVRVLEDPGRTGVGTERHIFDGLEALHFFFSNSDQTEGQPPMKLSIGADAVPAIAKQDDTVTFDLAAALNAYLEGQRSLLDEVIVPLTFTTAVPGILTVSPPRIEYEI